VPSKTTLLGLLKHVTYVEGVWFDQAISGRSYAEIGISSTPDRSLHSQGCRHHRLHSRSSSQPL